MKLLEARRLLWLALLVSLSHGRAAHAAPVSFGDARRSAEQKSPDVRLAAQRVNVSRQQIAIAETLANPTLSVTSATQSAHLGTAISVPLPLFGQRGAAVDAARAEVEGSARDASFIQGEARWSATLAWIDLWEAQERVRLLSIANEDAKRLLSIATERFDAGLGARVDVVRTRAALARAEADVLSARATVRAAGIRLSPWLGEQRVELSALGAIGYRPTLPNLGTLQRWQAQHPALQRDRAAVQTAQMRVHLERRLRWPIVNVDVGVNQFDPTMPGRDYFGGLSFELPVLNQRGGEIARASSERALAHAEADADMLRLRAELEAAYREAEGAASQLNALHTNVVPALMEARQMTEESYRSGRVDLIRLLETQRALNESQVAEVAAVGAWGRALANLERATGTRLDVGGSDAQ